jgi:hypothetical protein
MMTMEKVKEVIAVLLMLYIVAGIFALLYQLLVWHSFSKVFSYTLLVALVSLKGTVVCMRRNYEEKELTKSDWSKIIFLLQLGLLIFCLILIVTFSLKAQWIAALMALLIFLFSAYRVKSINPFTDTNL